MGRNKLLVYLFRRDLRVTDNPVLRRIVNREYDVEYTHLLPIFVIPPHQVEVSGFLAKEESSPYPQALSAVGKFWRCGPHRAKFLAQSVWDLKTSLEDLRSGLVVRVGTFSDVLEGIIESLDGSDHQLGGVWMTDDKTFEETKDQDAVFDVCNAHNIEYQCYKDEKYFIDDNDIMVDSLNNLPPTFSAYRKPYNSLRNWTRPSIPRPEVGSLLPFPGTDWLPSQRRPFEEAVDYEDLVFRLLKPVQNMLPNISPRPPTSISSHPMRGGETQAWHRLHHLAENRFMGTYSDTRNGLSGPDFSTKLSGYLALGCITARSINEEMIKFEDNLDAQYHEEFGFKDGETTGTTAIRYELLWRDFMRLIAMKEGYKLFRLKGYRSGQYNKTWKTPNRHEAKSDQDPTPARIQEMLNRFLEGRTGMGLIDASQRELYHTGYTSNRTRQNVASFFSRYLEIDWRYGAEWYEAMLIDYDVASNWGNWQYVAGVGSDPRSEDRVFNPVKQSFSYDSDAKYTRMWVPEVKNLTKPENVFQAWTTSATELQRHRLVGNIMVTDPLVKINYDPERAPRPANKPYPWYMRRRGGGRGGGSGSGSSSNSSRGGHGGNGSRPSSGENQGDNNHNHDSSRTSNGNGNGNGHGNGSQRGRGNSRGRNSAMGRSAARRGGSTQSHQLQSSQTAPQTVSRNHDSGTNTTSAEARTALSWRSATSPLATGSSMTHNAPLVLPPRPDFGQSSQSQHPHQSPQPALQQSQYGFPPSSMGSGQFGAFSSSSLHGLPLHTPPTAHSSAFSASTFGNSRHQPVQSHSGAFANQPYIPPAASSGILLPPVGLPSFHSGSAGAYSGSQYSPVAHRSHQGTHSSQAYPQYHQGFQFSQQGYPPFNQHTGHRV